VPDEVTAALERAYREEWARVLATVARDRGGDLVLAEDAAQDAFVAAAADWPVRGVPANPGAWLTTTARRKAVDRVRRDQTRAANQPALERLEEAGRADAGPGDGDDAGDGSIVDDRLRLVFTCCHPALAIESRIALTLRTLCGLGVPEIARAFLTTESAMQQRIVRAKRKIIAAGIPYRVPPAHLLAERLAGVRHVVYLVFTEGHAASTSTELLRTTLSDEAIRLARLLTELVPDDAETHGLLALLLLTDARRAARVDATGDPVALDRQDRAQWDQLAIAEGVAVLEHAATLGTAGAFQLQAAVAALHDQAGSFPATDWAQITALYAALERIDPSPVVRVNRAIAIAQADGPHAGLAVLRTLDGDERLARYQPYHAARAELLRTTGDTAGADAALAVALELTDNERMRTALARRHAPTG
jgi:RNA polymerase sigma-70 factor, ECF subfamily